MKCRLISFLCLAGVALAAEPVTLPLELGTLTTIGVGSRTYDGVKVIGQDAVGIKITHEGGTSRIAYQKLPHDLAARFAVDPEAAKAQLQKEAEANAAHDRAITEGLKTSGGEGMKKEGGAAAKEEDADDAFIARIMAEDKPNPTGQTKAQRIASLRIYIERMTKEVNEADVRLRRRMENGPVKREKRANSGNSEKDFLKNAQTNAHEDAVANVYAKQTTELNQAKRRLEGARDELYELEKQK